jgi:CBS domain-containing protein
MPMLAGMMATPRVASRRAQAGSRTLMKPSMTIWPERVPVVEDGRLVGVLSRVVLQRRLAEDEPPGEEEASSL